MLRGEGEEAGEEAEAKGGRGGKKRRGGGCCHPGRIAWSLTCTSSQVHYPTPPFPLLTVSLKGLGPGGYHFLLSSGGGKLEMNERSAVPGPTEEFD
eukprot:762705-Hanusia_phi.AAC.1